ncbi:hypothetical protein C9374_007945 [Naegleria lovaniensis]|uniref:NAD(P)-binding domain-containing protein n=1 Tax=Naegleria lovaniensis TaxID=51637 RepID=A0AA88GK14_NAELO|nr:uncharacterized protein C9374_007945 [Naegleria lovaniensis]KAG2378797.1 hypothetical protein C9374_007945 [Naegleria lovaniensis]
MSSPSIQNTQEEYAILGATQGIGNELLKLLLIRGVKVRVLARNPSSLSQLASNPLLTIVKGDATNAKDVETLISTSQYKLKGTSRLVDSCLTLDYEYRIGNDFLRNATNVMSRADVAAFMLRCMFDQTLKISAGSNQIFNVDTKRVLPKEHDSNFGLMTLLRWTLPRHQYLMIKMGVHSIQIAGVAMLAYYFFPQQVSGWWNALSTSAVRFFGVSSTGSDHK